MTKEKFLTLAVIFLLVLNIGIVGYVALARLGPSPHPELFKMVVHELNFDDRQQQQYFALRDEHRGTMEGLDETFGESLEQYLQQLKESPPDSLLLDSLETRLAGIEKKKASVTFRHFLQVKALCRPDQLKDFDRIVPQLTRILLPPKNPHPPRRN